MGLRPLRPSFLDDLSATEARYAAGRRAEIHDRARLVTKSEPMRRYSLDDDDEDEDEVDDDVTDSNDDDGDDEDEEDEEDEGEEETWQVSEPIPFR